MSKGEQKTGTSSRAFIALMVIVFQMGIYVGYPLGRLTIKRDLRARGYEIVHPTREPWYVATATPDVWDAATVTPIARGTAMVTPQSDKDTQP